jgi:uncharacterized membrane protein
MKDFKSIGPLQLMVIGFDRPNFDGSILAELKKLRKHRMIRIVDGLAVYKGMDDSISAIEATDLPKEEKMEYGAIIAGLIGLGSGDEEIAEEMAVGGAMLVDSEYEYGMNAEELDTVTEDIPKGGAAIMLLVEHLWALPLKRAVRQAGGIVIAQDFLSPEVLIGIGQKEFETVSH